MNRSLTLACAALRALRTDAGLCAIELADPARAEERLTLARRALSEGYTPRDLGLTFVVAIAELAYQVDWSDQFSFWPRLHEQLGCSFWDPGLPHHRDSCTAAFVWFAEAHGGLRPAGRFALAFPHMSWPLFHAVLPRAAHRRMARLLAEAAADPRLVVAADGCPDESDLGALIKAFALTAAVPAYFEGLLSNPAHIGRIAALLLRPTEKTSTEVAARPWLLERILKDLQQDAVASGALEVAREETVERAREAAARRLPVPSLSVGLTLVGARLIPRVEVSALEPAAKDSRAIHAALEHPDTKVELEFGGRRYPCGAAGNLRFGPVGLPVSWPAVGEGFTISLSLQGSDLSDHVEAFFARISTEVALPKSFVAGADGVRFESAEELTPGEEVAVLVSRADERRVARLADLLGLRRIPVAEGDKVVALVGTIDETRPSEWRSLAGALGLRIASRRILGAPALVPPLRGGSGWAEWLDDTESFILFSGLPAAAEYKGIFAAAEGQIGLAVSPVAGGILAVVPPSRGAGRVTLLGDSGPVATFEVRRRVRPHHREAVRRYRAQVVPRGATTEHLLGDACGLDILALPGVHLRLALQADDAVLRVDLDDAARSPLATAAQLSSLWRAFGREVLTSASRVSVLVEDADAGEEGIERLPLEGAYGFLGFDVAEHSATAVARGEVPVVTVERYPADSGLLEAPQELLAQLTWTHETPPGIYIARAADGESAALAWAPRGERGSLPGQGAAERRTVDVGRAAALNAVRRLRQVERAAAGPRSSAGAAMMMREHAAASLRGRLVASLCGQRWAAAETTWSWMGLDVDGLVARAATLVWAPLPWLKSELPELVAGGGDLVSVVEALCRAGVGDSLGPADAEAAAHVALLLSRASLAAPEDDERHLRWAAASPMRPRVVRLVALALATARREGPADA
jgi:hypothetical protein